jgi:hypothetical protein
VRHAAPIRLDRFGRRSRLIDTNENGSISRAELRRALSSIGVRLSAAEVRGPDGCMCVARRGAAA